MNLESFSDVVIGRFCENLTDHVFVYIESDKDLLAQYQLLVAEQEKSSASPREAIQTVNSFIGRKIREKFNLGNLGRSETPKSRLIKSFERHCFITPPPNRR